MTKPICILSAAVLLLCSCQKEKSLEGQNNLSNGGVTPTTDKLLTRVVSKAGADSASNDYGYDANKRLVTINYTSTKGGNQYIHLYRNSAGLLTQYSIKSDDLAAAGIDSIYTTVYYDAASSRYSYSITDIQTPGVLYRDSTIFNYDGSGKMVNKTGFAKAGPSNYQYYRKDDYSYNTANNIAVAKFYSYDATASNWDLLGTYNYTYDSNVNPLPLGVEGLIALGDVIFPGLALDGITADSGNNATSYAFVDGSDPASNFAISTTLNYDSNNKPTDGTSTETPGSGSYSITYYYN